MWSFSSLEKDPDAGEYWGQENKVRDDEIVEWHYWLSGHESEQTQGDSEGQGSWGAADHVVTKSWMLLNDWRTAMIQ